MEYIAWICWSGSFLFGALVIYLPVRYRLERLRYTAAKGHWVRTDALVQACSVRVIPRGRTLTAFHRHPSVTYTYRAGGVEREGRNAFLCRKPPFEREDLADAWLAAHRPGHRVPVWYDPKDPASSALELNPPDGADLLSTGLVMGAVSIALALSALSA